VCCREVSAEKCLLPGYLGTVPADAALPAELVQAGARLAGVDEHFDQTVLGPQRGHHSGDAGPRRVSSP
jgi:hypothetical protein